MNYQIAQAYKCFISQILLPIQYQNTNRSQALEEEKDKEVHSSLSQIPDAVEDAAGDVEKVTKNTKQ